MTAPTRPAAGERARSPFAALVLFALRTSLPRRRRLALLAPVAASLLFGVLTRGTDGPLEPEFARVAATALFALVLPVTALIVGDGVLGAEVRRGSFTFTWMSPVPAWQVALARWLAGTLVAGVGLAVAFALAAVVAGAPGDAGAIAIAGAAGAAAYVAVFVAIGSVAQRAAVWSLAFVFLVERLLGAALAGIAQLSPSWVARAAYLGLVGDPASLHRAGVPHGVGALVRLALIAVVALVVTVRRLPRLRMAGSSD